MAYSFDYIKSYYGLDFIKRGMEVEVYNGKRGRITSAYGSSVRIRLDGEKNPGHYHPTWEIIYFDSDGSIIADYREKPRSMMYDQMTAVIKKKLEGSA